MYRTCYIFFYEGYISLSPTIFNFSKLLDINGYLVTIFATQNNEIPQPEKIGSRVRIVYFPKIFSLYLFLQRPILKSLIRTSEMLVFSLQIFSCLLPIERQTEKLKSNINVGVDLHGLSVALLCYYFFRQKFIFLSLELEQPENLFRYVFKPFSKIAKLAYRKSECIIVQDEDRFKTLCEYYQYQHPKVFYLPNSPINDLSPDVNTKNFFREKFNLSQEKFPYIVLQAGMISDNVCAKSLAHSFASIDNGCALILHGVDAEGLREEHPYIRSLRQVNSKNLFLSLNPLPFEEVDKIYTSSTIGLALYANLGDNFIKIAKASGKLGFFLKHAKPVLVSNFPSLSQLVEKYQFGIVINDPSDAQEIKVAIEKILGSYDMYSNNSKSCFEAEFDFEKKFAPVLSYMNSFQNLEFTRS